MENDSIDYGSLGKGDSYAVYSDQFDSSLLNPMSRSKTRERWGIRGDEFFGYDVWHCYESTFLLNEGLPIAGTLKFVYPCNSESMVESKSMKLYLNSFDMVKMGRTIPEARENYERQIKTDLENLLQCPVSVGFNFETYNWNAFNSYSFVEDYVTEYKNALDFISQPEVFICSDYLAQGNYIELDQTAVMRNNFVKFYTNVLRSRCRHTKQKDSGTALLYHASTEALVTPASFLRQIISLREVNEFHELCSEKLFLDFKRVIAPKDDLMIILLYSRRGSLDINPVRASKESLIPFELIDSKYLTLRAPAQ